MAAPRRLEIGFAGGILKSAEGHRLIDQSHETRVRLALTARGIEADLVPLVGAYVLLMAIAGPILTRFADHFAPARTPPLARQV